MVIKTESAWYYLFTAMFNLTTRIGFGITCAIGLSILCGFFAGCSKAPEAQDSGNNKIKIVVALYPYEEFSRRIGGNNVNVTNIIPPGVDAHSWEPKPSDLKVIAQADIFIYNGAKLQPQLEKLINSIPNQRVLLLELAKNIGQDPHVWMDPGLAKNIVEQMRDTLIIADPKHRADYQGNATQYLQQLDELIAEYDRVLSTRKRDKIVMNHATVGYLARRYGFEIVQLSGLTPDAEPSPADLVRVIKLMKKEGISVVYQETFVSSKVIAAVARETNAKILMIDHLSSLQSGQIENGDTYISVMKNNLQNLAEGLETVQ